MKHLLIALGSFSVPFLFVSCVAYHTCSGKEMSEMKGSGLSVDEINKMCTGYKIPDEAVQAVSQALQSEIGKNLQNKPSTASAPQNSWQPPSYRVVQGQATTCVTQVGVCPLMEPGYRGAPCTCYTGYAQFPGVMR